MRIDARDERIVLVVEPLLPRRIADPRELAVAPDAEKRDVAGGLVVLTDMRVIDVAEVVLMIEVDHEIAVADGKVARHVERIAAKRGAAVAGGTSHFTAASRPCRSGRCRRREER